MGSPECCEIHQSIGATPPNSINRSDKFGSVATDRINQSPNPAIIQLPFTNIWLLQFRAHLASFFEYRLGEAILPPSSETPQTFESHDHEAHEAQVIFV